MEETRKKYGEFFEIFSRIEGHLVMIISSIFISFPEYKNTKHSIFSSIINYALHDHKIFNGLEQKINFLKLILKGLEYKLGKKNTIIINTRNVLKKIQKLQEIRNKLAHRWIIFQNDGKVRFPNHDFFKKNKTIYNETEDLDLKINEANLLLNELQKNHTELTNLVFKITSKG